jgi:hypothetical protein
LLLEHTAPLAALLLSCSSSTSQLMQRLLQQHWRKRLQQQRQL